MTAYGARPRCGSAQILQELDEGAEVPLTRSFVSTLLQRLGLPLVRQMT